MEVVNHPGKVLKLIGEGKAESKWLYQKRLDGWVWHSGTLAAVGWNSDRCVSREHQGNAGIL